MSTEKIKILEMIQEGKITAAEGLELLNALEDTESKETAAPSRFSNRFLRVRVNGGSAKKVNVNIPLGLIRASSKLIGFGMGFIPAEARAEMEKKGVDLTKLDIEEFVRFIDEGLVDGKLVDVDTDDPVEGKVKVEVYVE